MQGQPEAEAWRRRLDLPESGPGSLRLLPALPQERLWDLFHRAQVLVSPGAHDGTPNSLLEGMACGCFPVAGDIESLREWIRDGENGRLVDPADPVRLAEAAAQALESPELRREAARVNARLVEERAGVEAVRGRVGEFYYDVVSGRAVNGF
jgi:glycosyltransferase involved in cell wall biosynthesis